MRRDTEASVDLLTGRRVGPYQVEALLGAGGMGVVYRAHDDRLGRDVALKVLQPAVAKDAEVLARFGQEARVLASLNHPNIAQLYGLEESGDVRALVLELVEGLTLADRIASGPLQVREALDIARQIAEALAAAHRQGIIHRDLKPANVKVRPDGTVKVLDFGLAKALDQAAASAGSLSTVTGPGTTAPGLMLGTPLYMSPEQMRGQSPDARADLWAFGCVLFEMLAGRSAFGAPTLPEVCLAVLDREPDWRALAAGTPRPILTLLRRCLTKDVKDRLDSAAAARIEIEDVAARPAQEPRPGYPVGRIAPLRRWAIPAAAAVLVIAGVLGFLWRREGSAPAPQPIRSIAVLPLSNLSSDEAQGYLSDGMTDALINALGRVSALRVTSRTSIMQYKNAQKPLPQIARELGVEAIVEGSVVREGNRVRVTAQLIHASTDRHIWGGSYEQDLVDLLSLQQQLARTIAEQVRATLTPAEERLLLVRRQVVPAAQDAYLRGLHLFNTGLMTADNTEVAPLDLLARSIAAFEETTELEPDWAEAWAALSRSRHWVASYGQRALYPSAKAAALRALALDESNAEAHGALAFILQRFEWKWADAEREFKRGIEINPSLGNAGHHGYAIMLSVLGRHDEAMAMYRKAEELDPLVLPLKQNAASGALAARRYDEALDRSRRALEVNPGAAWAYEIVGRVRVAQGRGDEALAAFRRFQELSPGADATARVACGMAHTGQRAEAERLATSLVADARSTGSPPELWWEVAVAHACLDDPTSALDALERAFAGGVETLPNINRSGWFDGIRSTPRFQALLAKMNLPAAAP